MESPLESEDEGLFITCAKKKPDLELSKGLVSKQPTLTEVINNAGIQGGAR